MGTYSVSRSVSYSVAAHKQTGFDTVPATPCGVNVYLIGNQDPDRAGIPHLLYQDGADRTQVLDKITHLDPDRLPLLQSVQLSTWIWDSANNLAQDPGGSLTVTLQGAWGITAPPTGRSSRPAR